MMGLLLLNFSVAMFVKASERARNFIPDCKSRSKCKRERIPFPLLYI
jgi:hypothetical protein